MAAVWPLQMPPSPKAVLVSLADNANDEGHCFPSIATMCERTCLGRTAVIDAVKWLEQHGALRADRSNGRHTTYTLTPEAFTNQSATRTGSPPLDRPDPSVTPTGPSPVEPANPSASRTGPLPEPVRQPDGTSPPGGRDQSARRTLTVKEPSRNRQEKNTPARPDEVAEAVWADWLQLRKAKRAEVTPTALAGIAAEARKAGWSLEQALAECCSRGWTGFKAGWVSDARQTHHAAPTAAAVRSAEFMASVRRPVTHDPEVIDVTPAQAAPRRLGA